MSQVEVDEVLCLMSDETSEIPPNNTVPGCAFLVVELCG